MKHTYKYILSALVLILPVLVKAQTATEDPPIWTGYKITNGVATKKTVTGPENGRYTITLETYATGEQELSVSYKPVDVVLVLDVSGSMTRPKGSITTSSKSSYSYDDIVNGSVEYFYDNYRVYAEKDGDRYYLYVNPEEKDSGYLRTYSYWGSTYVTTGTKSQASYSTSETGAILNNIRLSEGTSRITALQNAVSVFIQEIDDRDHTNAAGEEIPRVGNQISIIKFGGPGNTYYNKNEIVVPLMKTEGNVTTIQNAVGGLEAMGYTEAWEGMRLANSVLEGSKNNGHEKVVVMFTDGEPDGVNETTSYAYTETISRANTTKNTYNATVYTVGTFTSSPGTRSNTYKYLNAVSSNYSTATGLYSNNTLTITGTGAMGGDYYKDASGTVNLTAIFQEIAGGIGHAEAEVSAATRITDGVSNSFKLPANYSANDATLKVYSRSVVENGSYGSEGYTNTWSAPATLTKVVLTSYNPSTLPPSNADYMTAENKVGVYLNNATKELTVLGFDYSKADSPGANGTTQHPFDGNWVGWRYNSAGNPVCVGKELVIEFQIEADPDATGGDGTNTNTENSGVFVPTFDDQGNFLGYESANSYTKPNRDLPINLVIVKKGLKHGESATIQIYMAPQSTEYDKNTGKLKPDLTSNWGGGNNNGVGWGNFSKVILTNKGKDNDDVTETLLCLDPTFVYLLEEDNWGWAYNLDTKKVDTSQQEKNPFTFTNTEKTETVKHAEAASFNRFGENLHGRQRKETVKSKEKIESPVTPGK